MSRYIDADAIQYRKVCKEEIDGNMRVEYMVLRDEIDDIPTADVRENIRAEWIKGDNSLTCPRCGAHGEDIRSDFTFNFCPNCGADMRPITALSKNAEIVANLKRGEA